MIGAARLAFVAETARVDITRAHCRAAGNDKDADGGFCGRR
ncbi:hypothetical protein ACX80U_18170 [Arthrobacter sp. TmT3-37]